MGPLRQAWRFTTRVLLLVLAVSAGAAPPGVAAGTPADDGYHRALWVDGRHDSWYTEWWYFNVCDAGSGVQAIFSYFISNPTDLRGLGQVQMVASAYTPDGVVSAIDLYPLSAFAASAAQADVAIGTNTAHIQNDGSYLISGASRDQRLAWNLVYTPESAPWPAADRLTVGRLPWERMSWLVEMPRARVVGELSVDGRRYAIDAPGYHDHNWGEWIPTDGLWNWAQFSDERLDLEVGDFIGKPVGVVSLALDGERSVFGPDQYRLSHTRWAWDPQNRLFYPSESRLTADNGSLRVEVSMAVLQDGPLRGDLPLPLKDLIIYEQPAAYQGRVLERRSGPDARWRVKAWIQGTGFKEWTAKHY